MPKPRKTLVSLEATPYYHCVSRCVRRAFLCGEDTHTGQSFEHRRQWIEDRLLELAGLFAIDIAAYRVLSNHYHVALHINKKQASSWSEIEVVERWHGLFKRSFLSQRYHGLVQQQDKIVDRYALTIYPYSLGLLIPRYIYFTML